MSAVDKPVGLNRRAGVGIEGGGGDESDDRAMYVSSVALHQSGFTLAGLCQRCGVWLGRCGLRQEAVQAAKRPGKQSGKRAIP
jgi:hypothetical protein